MISTRCPYCDNRNNNNFTFKKYSNTRDIICSKCGLNYKASFTVYDTIYTYEEELKKVLPQDKIDTVKRVITKYLGYSGKGGYENSENITLNREFNERISNYDNALVISLKGTATYYSDEYRTVRFYITHDSVRAEVTSEYTWAQKYWFVGETLEEKVDNYIQQALVKWKTI